MQSASADDENVLIGLVTSFVDSLTSNAELAAAYQGVGASFLSTFKASSVEEFLKSAVEDLLEVVKAVLITGVALIKAVIDSILSSIDSVVAVLQDITSVSIPILSALWKKITGNELTVLDLISFVVAFPVTFMYKAFDGTWPGDSVSAAETMPRALRNVKGLMGATASTLSGIFSTLEDTDPKGVEPGFLRKMAALLTEITENGLGTVDTAYAGDAASIITTTSSWVSLAVSLITPHLPKAYEAADEIVKFATGLLNFFTYAGQGGSAAEIARGIVGSIPAVVVWTKHIKGPAELIPPIADIMCGLAVAGIELGITFNEWNGDDIEIPVPSRLSRQYLPVINHQPADYRQLLPSVLNGGGN